MRAFKFWLMGLIMIFVFLSISNLLMEIGDYQFARIKLNVDLALLVLWVVPAFSSFLASRHSMSWIGLPGLSYLILIPILAVAIEKVKGISGMQVDFPGTRGAWIVFQIYFLCSLVPVLIGFAAGIIFRDRS
ncbi:hypothetical protein [Caballeronia sp. NK8]|uniref:hypothetical protein n=1 Tax=Caballeronia sp. NK8 TaxID=140098 RepID=UPI001BD08623|nr:hypothetical protein [Caballeronia sp. NK8]